MKSGHIAAIEFLSKNDAAGQIAEAKILFETKGKPRGADGFEVWDGPRLVYRSRVSISNECDLADHHQHHFLLVCPRCGQQGFIWYEEEGNNEHVTLSQGFHSEPGRIKPGESVIVCDRCYHIHIPS
ncbi:MAG TPA: hypothetical protein VKB67_07450 [Rhizomicrobium sp.]|nr:hypothetical protein [Rhizomicrobium sp.]